MWKSPWSSLWFALIVVGVVACSDDDPGRPEQDASVEAGLDASRDAADPFDAADVGPDIDARMDVPDAQPTTDASDGATTDAASADSGLDARVDSGPACDAAVAPLLPALRLERVPGAQGITELVYAAQPKGSPDWYLVQHGGTIRRLRNGVLQTTPFIDVTAELPSFGGGGDERGLLSMVFAPDYASSGKLYVMMTPTAGDNANADTVYEFQRAPDGMTATRSRTILTLPVSVPNHNGGTVAFGPDGFLYVGTGDGGGSCNSNDLGSAQDPHKLFGKILRLDPGAPAPHAAPNHPFEGDAGDSRVLHTGLRNPFRFGIDRRTGDLIIGDVGQNSYEEVDYAPAAARALNFGWPAFEGDHADTCGTTAGYALYPGTQATKPIVDIPRLAGATGPFADYASVIGGPTYRGSVIPELEGVTIFGDYVGKRMGAFRRCGSQTSPITVVAKARDPNTPATPGFTNPQDEPLGTVTAIVEDDAGELYFIANGGNLWKLVPGR